MASEEKLVCCPVCSKELPFEKINSHVDICLRTSAGGEGSKRRRSSDQNRTETSRKRSKPAQVTVEHCNDKTRGIFSTLRPGNCTPKRKTDSGGDNTSSVNDTENKSTTLGKSDHSNSIKNVDVKLVGKKNCPQASMAEGKKDFRPLAERMRPQYIEDFVGQSELLGRNHILQNLISSGQVPSLILCGPPGSGKTTLASIITKKMKDESNIKLVKLSATTSNVAEVKKVIAEATNMQRMFKRKTVLFMDEIHRFNKLQQDTFLPVIENGTITLLGATTENPSFSLNSALLSRCQVIMLKKHSIEDLELILTKAAERMGVTIQSEPEDDSSSTEDSVSIQADALSMLVSFCDGDARSALNILEMAVNSCQRGEPSKSGVAAHTGSGNTGSAVITVDLIKDSLQRSHVQYDRTGDEHYNCISALHKSMRGSDADASLYWLGRMLVGGEDPLYVARRLIEFSSCDIGLADPLAMVQAVSTYQACQFLGMPVCQVNLAQCVTYLARAPKSIDVSNAYNKVTKCITEHQGPMPGVPLHLRNAPTKFMKDLGYGKGYNPAVRQVYMPEGLENVKFFPR